jgi:hypothetical protein
MSKELFDPERAMAAPAGVASEGGAVSPGQRRPSEKRLAQDPLVERLVPDPSSHRSFTMLRGFLGKSGREGFWRLYLTPELDQYVEFAEGDVEHTQEATAEQAPFGGSYVWLRAGAPVTHAQVSTRQMQAEFLRGGITAGYLRGAAPAPIGPIHIIRNCPSYRGYCDPDTDVICRTGRRAPTLNLHVPMCQSENLACGGSRIGCGGGTDVGPLCDSGHFICGETVGCTWGAECGYSPHYAC